MLHFPAKGDILATSEQKFLTHRHRRNKNQAAHKSIFTSITKHFLFIYFSSPEKKKGKKSGGVKSTCNPGIMWYK